MPTDVLEASVGFCRMMRRVYHKQEKKRRAVAKGDEH
jgi:hypothetical protein